MQIRLVVIRVSVIVNGAAIAADEIRIKNKTKATAAKPVE